MSNLIRDCIGLALLRSVIGLDNPRHPLRQSDAKLKLIATWSLAFSRASDRLHVLTLSWLVPCDIYFALIGRCGCFGFGFTALLNEKAETREVVLGARFRFPQSTESNKHDRAVSCDWMIFNNNNN